jgi:hypothetical protein
MARTKISEFSSTPANNTDIDSINIAEGCAPSGINDAIRELMSQLKDFQTGAVGDSFNGPVGTTTAAAGAFTTLSASSTLAVTGVATLTAQPILSSLTASRAVFTDASKGLVSNAITGTGNVVMSTSPTLVTPTLGVATATSLQGIIGNVTPAAGTFTTVTGSNDASINGLTVGRGAGAVATNTAAGSGALATNSSGDQNTALGYQALNLNSTGGNSTGVGYLSLSASTAGSNSALGARSLQQNTSGASNSSFGAVALYSNLTGSFNSAFGADALRNNTASQNTAVGYQAMLGNTSGDGTALGYRALYTATNRTSNTAVGNSALFSCATDENTAVGALALRDTSTGTANVAMGVQAGVLNTTGASNTAIGYLALNLNTVGNNNTALGRSALVANTASNNTAVGYQALNANTTGTSVVAVGYRAGYANISSNSSTYVGVNSGLATTGQQNTFLGQGSGEAITSGAKNTIIGRYDGNTGGLDIRTASNYIVLSDGDGNPRGVFDGNGNFGVGVTNPAYYSGQIVSSANGASISMFALNNNNTGSSSQNVFDMYRAATRVGTISNTNTATSYNTSSDYRLKNTIAPMTGALAKVALLKPCTYKWNADGSDGEGFIAHELAEVCPHAVNGDKDAIDENGKIKPQGIDTSFLIATLTAAIQELKAEFDAYKATHP